MDYSLKDSVQYFVYCGVVLIYNLYMFPYSACLLMSNGQIRKFHQDLGEKSHPVKHIWFNNKSSLFPGEHVHTRDHVETSFL